MTIVLNSQARQQFSQYAQNIARLNGVDSAFQRFNVAPAPQQRIIQAYQESADFLKLINIYPVDHAKGEKLGMGVGTSLAGTTDTRQQKRRPTVVGSLDLVDVYECDQVNYDAAYRWPVLNAWSHMPDFKPKLANMVVRAVALDKIRAGWNGRFRAPTSDRIQYPNLEDTGRGWLQRLREVAPEQVYSGELVGGVRKTIVGAAGPQFKTLDGLVETAIEEMIHEQFREDDLMVICGRGLLSEKYLPLLNTIQNPTEQLSARMIYANKQLGTRPAVHIPFFPAKTMLITTFQNLSIYIQNGTFTRHLKEEPEWDRTADYQSICQDYVIEELGCAALIENIEVEI